MDFFGFLRNVFGGNQGLGNDFDPRKKEEQPVEETPSQIDNTITDVDGNSDYVAAGVDENGNTASWMKGVKGEPRQIEPTPFQGNMTEGEYYDMMRGLVGGEGNLNQPAETNPLREDSITNLAPEQKEEIKEEVKEEIKEEPKDEDVITYTYKPGDTFGQVIKDLGLSTDKGLWGKDGDVAYYTQQLIDKGLWKDNNNVAGNIPIGTTIALKRRK